MLRGYHVKRRKQRFFAIGLLAPIFCLAGFTRTFAQVKNCDFWGNGTFEGRAVTAGDNIKAYDPQGNLCGSAYSISGGQYGIHVQGDDPTTPQDEGAVDGDAITFKINGKTANITGGSNIWTNNGSKQCNLNVPVPPPDAPSNLNATAVSDVRIDLSWQDNASDEDGFKIERKTGLSGTWSQIATVGANTTGYQNTGLSPGTTYYYRVRAYNSGGNSSYSNTDNAKTHSIPNVPGSLSAWAVSMSRIDIAWSDNSGNEDGFKIERKQGSAGSWSQIASVGANVESYNSIGLSSGTKYYYRVRAYNSIGNSDYSNTAGATTGSLPSKPTNLTANTVSTSRIDLSWNDNSNNETGFQISRKTGAGGTWSQIATVGANTTIYQNTDLSSGTGYEYRIRAVNTWGQSDYSNVAGAATLTPLPSPSGLTASASSESRINLSWNDRSNNENGFKIERKTGDTGTWSQIASVSANSTGYSNSGLNPSTLYKYRVRAYNASMHSSYSNVAQAATQGPPAKPEGLFAEAVSTTRIDLEWQDESVNEDGFKIDRKEGASGNWTEIASVTAGQETYEDANLDSGTTYHYRVHAHNVWGVSDYSDQVTETTGMLPAKPSDLFATVAGVDRIDLEWVDIAVNEEGFKIERKEESGGEWIQIAELGMDKTRYTDEGLTANTNYQYRLRSFNSWGQSGYSAVVSATTMAIAPPYLSQCYPPHGAKAVPRNAKIRFRLREQGYGIDMSEFHVRINGEDVVTAGQDQTGGDVNMEMSGAGLTFCYAPSREFEDESTVAVDLRYQDTASPPNVSDTTYAFEVIGHSVFRTHETAIGTGGGKVVDGFSGLEIHFPDGAVSDTTLISIGIIKSPPVLPEGVIYHGLVYHFSPEGLQFGDSVTVCIPYTLNDLANAGVMDPLDLPVYYFSTRKGEWIRLHLSDSDADFVYTKVKEFCYLIFSKTSGLREDETVNRMPTGYRLHPNYPNPFNPSTTVAFEVPEQGAVNLRITDILGRDVITLVDGPLSPGSYQVVWDGSDENGLKVGNGVYILIMRANGFMRMRRVTLMK